MCVSMESSNQSSGDALMLYALPRDETEIVGWPIAATGAPGRLDRGVCARPGSRADTKDASAPANSKGKVNTDHKGEDISGIPTSSSNDVHVHRTVILRGVILF
jgi:hypothetical protein